MFHFYLGLINCPVKAYKEYMSRRPEDCRGLESRFYLQPIQKPKSEVWFQKTPVGKSSMGQLSSKMSILGGLHHKIKHGARKTGMQTLLHENSYPKSVALISCDESIQLLNSYSSILDQSQEYV